MHSHRPLTLKSPQRESSKKVTVSAEWTGLLRVTRWGSGLTSPVTPTLVSVSRLSFFIVIVHFNVELCKESKDENGNVQNILLTK